MCFGCEIIYGTNFDKEQLEYGWTDQSGDWWTGFERT